jgi:hypothetical protein
MSRYSSKSLFVYQSDNFNLAIFGTVPGSTATFNFNTQGDSDFFWEKFAVLALAPDPSSPPVPQSTTRDGDQLAGVTMTLVNTTTGRALSNNPVPLPNIDGFLQFHPEPMIWPKRSTIQITLENETEFTGSGAFAIISLSFIGTKAFF